jgi:hypothetical protein
MRLFKNKVQRKIFGPRTNKVTSLEKNTRAVCKVHGLTL